MIVCYSPKIGKVIVDSVLNKEDIYDRYWLIGIGCGFDCHMILIKAHDESDVLDIYADSSRRKGTKITQKELNKDYVQSGRKAMSSYLIGLQGYIDDMEDSLMDSDFTPTEAEDQLNDLKTETQDLIDNIDKLGEWDSNGPYDNDQVMWLGNYSDPHVMELRIFEPIHKSQIRFFHKRVSHLELTNEPFTKGE